MSYFKCLLFVLALSSSAWGGPDFNQMARRGERSSWENAKAWAHYLAVQDFIEVMSQVYVDVASSTIDQQELAVIQNNNLYLQGVYDNVANEADSVENELNTYVFNELTQYADNMKAQFHLSWDPTVQSHAFTHLNEVLTRTLERYEETCKAGRTSTMADTDIPALRIPSIATNVTITPNLDTVVGISAVVSGGDPDSDWQQHKGPVKMVTQTGLGMGMAASGAAAGTTAGVSLIVEMAFLIVDHFISRHEVRKMRDRQARAMEGYYVRKARNRDIVELYKQNCEMLYSGLKKYVQLVNSEGAARSDILATARSTEFQDEYREWVLREQDVDRAACRANLIQNFKNETCLDFSQPARPSKFVNQPACQRSLEGQMSFAGQSVLADDICPKVEVPEENNCRIAQDGKTLKLLNEPEHDQSCRVDSATYECSAEHIADLTLAGRDVERIECETREARAQAEEDRLQAAFDEAYERCMESSQSNGSNLSEQSNQLRCQQQAQWARDRAKTKTLDQIEKEEIEQFEINEEERQRQITALKAKMERVAEMLGHFTVLVVDEQQSNLDQIKYTERLVEAKRKAARERLLSLIMVIQKDFDHAYVIEEQEGARKWFELQARFSLLGAHAINNIVIGESNQAIVQELHNLMTEFDDLAYEFPGLALVDFNEAVQNVIRVVQ